jgi:DNA polymerase III delta subunit
MRGLVATLKDGLSNDTVLIMDGGGVDKRKQFYKCISEHGSVIEFNKPDMTSKGWEEEMRACIRTVAMEKGVNLSPQAEGYLLDVLGVDTARIDAELEKIICFRGTTEGVIELEDVTPVCVGKGEEMSWALSNMLGKRDIREALRVVDVLISQNHGNETYAFSMLFAAAKFFSQAIRIHVFMAENKIKTPVALKTAVMGMSPADKEAAVKRGMDFVNFNPYRIQNMAADVKHYSPQEVIHAVKVFRDAIWQCTSSAGSSRMILENALLEVIGTGGNVRYM